MARSLKPRTVRLLTATHSPSGWESWRPIGQAIGLTGAGEGIRTLDPNLGKVALWLLRRVRTIFGSLELALSFQQNPCSEPR